MSSSSRPWRIAIVGTRWNQDLVDCMEEDAVSCMFAHGIEDITTQRVAGAFELPQAAMALARAAADGRFAYDAIIALGVVIQGETPHFRFIAEACANGLGHVALERGVPVAFGVLTTDNREQAEQRVAFSREEPKTPLVDEARKALDAACATFCYRRHSGLRKYLELGKDPGGQAMSYVEYARGYLRALDGAQAQRKSKGWEAAEAALSLLRLEYDSAAGPTALFSRPSQR